MAAEALKQGIEKLYLRKGKAGLREAENSLRELLKNESVAKYKRAQARLLLGLINSKLHNIDKSLEELNIFLKEFNDYKDECNLAKFQIDTLLKLRKKEKKDTEYHGYIKGELHVAEESFYEKIRIPLIQSAILILIVFLG
ncbi:MAG: hypothetical protein AB1765_10175, partial [Candidatus Hydrogenedentota bacterium]